jgi:hypothetical protein
VQSIKAGLYHELKEPKMVTANESTDMIADRAETNNLAEKYPHKIREL